MSPRRVTEVALRETPVLTADTRVDDAVSQLLDSGLPALPVVAADGRYLGIFGEREFMGALFPGYLSALRSAGFVPKSVDQVLEKRGACRSEPVSRFLNAEHVDVDGEFSDAQVAEIFLHHRVLVVPVVDRGRVLGILTRRDFFEALATRFLDAG